MSNVDFFGTPPNPPSSGAPTSPAPFGAPAAAPAPTPRPQAPARRRTRLVAGVLVSVALVLAAAYLLQRPGPVDRRPVVLPDTLAGLPPAASTFQFADAGDWRESLRDVYGEHPFGGRAYGSIRPGPLINLVAVRGDFRDEADAGMGRPPFTEIGEVSCTHTFELPDHGGLTEGDPEPFTKDSWLICSRASDRLTVSAFVLIGGAGYERAVAAAVDEAWALQR